MLRNINQHPISKEVTYFGTKLWVPVKTQYLAAHRNGHINAYASRPTYGDDEPHWWDGNYIGVVATVDLEWADVKDSLVRVE